VKTLNDKLLKPMNMVFRNP